MLKKVVLNNVHTGRNTTALVDTTSDEKALIGAGKTEVETAKITDITGLDERIQRWTSRGASQADRVALFSGLAKCFERNLPIIKSFHLQANRMKSPCYRGAIAEIAQDLTQGEKMSDSMAKHSDLFASDVVALIRAGEESGRLPEIFRRIAESQKKTSRILRKLKAGMIYPGIVVTLAIGVIITMSFTLVPAMSKLYTSLESELPLPTQVLMKVSEILLKQPWMVVLPVLAIFSIFKNWGRIISIPQVQVLLVRLPLVGNIIRKSAATTGFRTLALLIEANIRLTTALEITRKTSWHIYYETFFDRVRSHILNGLTLPDAFLIESQWLGDDGRLICGLMEVGAETGAGTDLLNEIADDYEEELDSIANQIDKLIEPFTIVILGTLIGGLIYAIYAPVFSLGDALLKK